jgi:hypothetical protein
MSDRSIVTDVCIVLGGISAAIAIFEYARRFGKSQVTQPPAKAGKKEFVFASDTPQQVAAARAGLGDPINGYFTTTSENPNSYDISGVTTYQAN